PSLSVPAQRMPLPSLVATPVSDHTDKRTHRLLSWETRNPRGIPLRDRDHPSQSRIPRPVGSLAETGGPSRPSLQGSEIAANQPIRFVPVEVFRAINGLTQFCQHPVLNCATSLGNRVRNAMKGHHGILRHKEFGILCLQRQFHFLSKQEPRICNPVSHLSKILNRHIRDRVGIHLAFFLKFGKYSWPIHAVPVEQLNQTSAIFKSAVYPLAEERNDGVNRISEKQRPSFHMPWRALDGNHRSGRIREVIVGQLRHQRNCIRKARLEEIHYLRLRGQARKAIRALKRQK